MKPNRRALIGRIAVAIILVSLFAMATRSSSRMTPTGWVWNARTTTGGSYGLGWVSVNCLNDFDADGELEDQCDKNTQPDYGLIVDAGVNNALGGSDDRVKGCMWSSSYGWICASSGVDSLTEQCTTSGLRSSLACSALATTGISVVPSTSVYCDQNRTVTSCAVGQPCSTPSDGTCVPNYYHLASPGYSATDPIGFTSIDGDSNKDKRMVITSLYSVANSSESYMGFPMTISEPTLPTNPSVIGCFGCDPVTKRCAACYNPSTDAADATTNPNPNILCYDCGHTGANPSCTVNNGTGSCTQNKLSSSCPATSCTGCYAYGGVVVNPVPNNPAQYEMCGWGWHGFKDMSSEPRYEFLESAFNDTYTYGMMEPSFMTSAEGFTVLSYISPSASDYSGPTRDLEYRACLNADCSSSVNKTLVSAATYINPYSVVMRPNKGPLFLYSLFDNQNVYALSCADVSCDSISTTPWIPTSGSYYIALSVTIGTDGKPTIVGLTSTNKRAPNDLTVRVIKCTNDDCSLRNAPVTVSTKHAWISGIEGHISYEGLPQVAMVKDAGFEYPLISYFNMNTTNLSQSYVHLVRCANTDCSGGPNIETDLNYEGCYATGSTSPSYSIKQSRILVGNDDLPRIVYGYNDGTNSGIKVVMCRSSSCDVRDAPVSVFTNSIDGDYNLNVDAVLSNTVTQEMNIVAGIQTMSTPKIDFRTLFIRCSNSACSNSNAITSTQLYASSAYPSSVATDQDVVISQIGYPLIASTYRSQDTSPQVYGAKFITCGSEDCRPTARGLGWVAFGLNSDVSSSYTKAESGSVLSRGNIYSPALPPTTQYNASYLIEASGDITNWSSNISEQRMNETLLPVFPQQQIGSGIYRNVLGSLDVNGLITNVSTGGQQNGMNKYGSGLEVNGALSSPALLLNRMLYYSTAKTLADPLTLAIGDTASLPGSGIIVVNGDLTINGNITYETIAAYKTRTGNSSFQVSHISQLPSLVWVVKGDLTIAPSVTSVAGTFIVLGSGATCPSPSAIGNGCGRFSSGASSSQLVVNGAVMAKQFKLDRTYSALDNGVQEPAELFIADGRLQANPPRGLIDFSKAVPRFSTGR